MQHQQNAQNYCKLFTINILQLQHVLNLFMLSSGSAHQLCIRNGFCI